MGGDPDPDRLDRVRGACEQGIECPAEHYEPDSCRASVLIRDMRALRDALPLEAPPA